MTPIFNLYASQKHNPFHLDVIDAKNTKQCNAVTFIILQSGGQ